MNLKDEIQKAFNSEECQNCSLAIHMDTTLTDPSCFDCRLVTDAEFAQSCPAVETAIQEQVFEVYRDVLDDEGFLPVHQTFTKQTVFRVGRAL